MNKRIYLLILVLMLVIGGVKAQTVDIYDITATPGAILVQVDMLNYTDVGAISLYIDYDADLLSFTGITSTTLSGTWLSSAAYGQITITYTAPPLTGYPINGKLLDLKFNYSGGFASALSLTNDCEIANRYLAPITSTFINGSVSNDPNINTYTGAVGFMSGTVQQVGDIIDWPLIIQGNPAITGAFSAINSITLHLTYDPVILTYQNFEWNPAYTGYTVTGGAGVVDIAWTSATPQDFNSITILTLLKFMYNGVGDATLAFQSGSMVTSGTTTQNTFFVDGVIGINPAGPFDGALTISSVGALQGDVNVEVPVVASGFTAPDIGVISLNINFDPAKLTYKSYTANQFSGWVVNQSPAGTLNISRSNPTGVSIADGPLVTLKFDYLVSTQADISFVGGTAVQTNWFDNISVDLTDGFISAVPYTITATSNNLTFGSVTGGGSFLHGATVTLTATPETGYHFIRWTEGAVEVSTNAIYTFSATANRTLVAEFGGYSVSGVLKYANPTGAARPITSTTVNLKSSDGLTLLGTTTSDASGNFTFADVPDGSFKVDATISKAWGGLTLADYAIVRNFVNVGTPVLAGIYWQAADVNLSSTVTLADYAIIRNRVNTSSTAGWTAPNWLIPQVSVSVSGATVTGVNVLGICSGDVNTSYTPPL
ncbi:MAG: hypothetical protein HOO86_04555 [Bacteroidales bacterium]|nr:hypothetical protein [Bacteroidales bacterium]